MEGYDNSMAELNKKLNPDKTYLITGGAGFIGYHLAKRMMQEGCSKLILLDNLNAYYDLQLKKDRLKDLEEGGLPFRFLQMDIADREALFSLFEKEKPDIVINLAAQAGVRYSIEHPEEYIHANILGFFQILEACRYYPVEHLVYASSSSVYGMNQKVPFCESDKADAPVSLYAATKKSDELMAHAYAKLYNIPCTGTRFFTVYGPFGRPDMAYYKFAKKITAKEPIEIYNNGDMRRDFTFVDDVTEALTRIIPNSPEGDPVPFKVYNIGNQSPVRLMDFVRALEKALGEEAEKVFLPMQPGDVYETYSDVSELSKDFGFAPHTSIEDGLKSFAEWFKSYK